MDGMKYVVPYSCRNVIEYDYTLFGVEEKDFEQDVRILYNTFIKEKIS